MYFDECPYHRPRKYQHSVGLFDTGASYLSCFAIADDTPEQACYRRHLQQRIIVSHVCDPPGNQYQLANRL